MQARFLSVIAAATLSFAAHGQQYPSGPIKMIVPFGAGSSTDVVGREIAKTLSDGLHQSVIVENRPGAQSTIGAAEVARAAPDGATLLLGSNSSIAAAPFLFKQIPYRPLTDLASVARVGAVVFVLVTRADLPVKNAADLIAYGQQHPGKLTWGYANSANQAAAAALTHSGNVEANAIPYKSVPQLVVDMLGGRLDFAIIDITNATPQIKAGKLRALAVTTARRIPALPEVPPLGDTIKGFELVGWYGVYAPARTPAHIIDTLSRTILKGLKDPGLQHRLQSAGLTVFPADAATLAKFSASETEKWASLVKNAGIEPQ